ncbi:phosphatase PAP2 family protein [uncultured Legionella sp.]|uniref:phosphatase PAP2 family protein n=1 Tax=uncultured Legionella sp. TaxID=210934 RepID=UPI0026218493|nr:phosphatase PAP2 family protein [uncultured Legionella sp.]
MTQFETTFNLLKKPWMIASYIILVVLAYFFVDIPVATYFHQHDIRGTIPALTVFTALGKWKIYVLIFLFLFFYFRYLQKHEIFEAKVLYLFGCIFIPNVISFIIKVCLSRARPDLLFSSNLFGFYWFQTKDLYWSFPSGHSVTITGLACGLGVLFPKYFYAFLGFAVLVILSRIVLYHHYLSDVMTGAYLTILVVGFFTEFLKRKNYLKK